MTEQFNNIYGPLFQPQLLEEIEEYASVKEFEADSELLGFGEYIRSIPLLIDGTLKIMRQDDKENEILLYFLHPGQTCAMTLFCCIRHQKSEVKVVAETAITMAHIPVQKMEEWSSKYKSWRNFVFKNYHHQLMSAFKVIDSIAFSKLDIRLKEYLIRKKEITGESRIKTTHLAIAKDLNSSRVVISRLLKKLENVKKIQLHHNCIEIRNL